MCAISIFISPNRFAWFEKYNSCYNQCATQWILMRFSLLEHKIPDEKILSLCGISRGSKKNLKNNWRKETKEKKNLNKKQWGGRDAVATGRDGAMTINSKRFLWLIFPPIVCFFSFLFLSFILHHFLFLFISG